ncbi:MAG: hypothetical protein JO015_01065 [Verrucomicrobia bacterium]|nr:hypothetical protein [Verrucomicrobiota bacterium]
MRKLVLIAMVVAVAGCAVAPAPQPRTAVYNPSEYAPYGRKGNGRILGQAFLKTVGGDVKYGAGCDVVLHPVTSLTTEWFEKHIVQRIPLQAGDPRGDQYAVRTIANGEGRFGFEHLPAGQYYLTCVIKWGVPSDIGVLPAGGVAYAKVTVPENGTVAAIVTR